MQSQTNRDVKLNSSKFFCLVWEKRNSKRWCKLKINRGKKKIKINPKETIKEKKEISTTGQI